MSTLRVAANRRWCSSIVPTGVAVGVGVYALRTIEILIGRVFIDIDLRSGAGVGVLKSRSTITSSVDGDRSSTVLIVARRTAARQTPVTLLRSIGSMFVRALVGNNVRSRAVTQSVLRVAQNGAGQASQRKEDANADKDIKANGKLFDQKDDDGHVLKCGDNPADNRFEFGDD